MMIRSFLNLRLIRAGILLVLSLWILVSCYQETAIPVEADFNTSFINNDQSVPIQISIINQSEGADTYSWTFSGGQPSSSTDQNPGSVIYNELGTYTIQLTVSNIDGSTDTIEKSITVVDGIDLNFTAEILESNFSPVTVQLTNNTVGQELSYLWTFEDGSQETSILQNPDNVVFETSGDHTITLEVSNGFETFTESTTITVAPQIEARFDFEVDFFDDDNQVPVSITTTNNSISATSYQWTFPSGMPASSTQENPSATFSIPGTYEIRLEADNGKRTDVTTRRITVLPDTNLKTFENIELGINNAHNTNVKGAFFDATTREVYQANQTTPDNGALIDIVFFGLNNTFTFNKFVSPDQAGTNGFTPIPNATRTKIINSQELCNCGASLTPPEFDAMVDDRLLDALIITETANGSLQFDDTVLPRIVLFETEDGRKGAIKINSFVNDGANSFINCDIKIQKQP